MGIYYLSLITSPLYYLYLHAFSPFLICFFRFSTRTIQKILLLRQKCKFLIIYHQRKKHMQNLTAIKRHQSILCSIYGSHVLTHSRSLVITLINNPNLISVHFSFTHTPIFHVKQKH